MQEVDRRSYGAYEGHVAGYSFNQFPIAAHTAYFLRATVAGTLTPGDGVYVPD